MHFFSVLANMSITLYTRHYKYTYFGLFSHSQMILVLAKTICTPLSSLHIDVSVSIIQDNNTLVAHYNWEMRANIFALFLSAISSGNQNAFIYRTCAQNPFAPARLYVCVYIYICGVLVLYIIICI